MVCRHCGKEVTDGVLVCGYCGHAVPQQDLSTETKEKIEREKCSDESLKPNTGASIRVFGIALMIISISPLAAASNLDESAGMLLRLDCSAVLIMAVIFVIGAWGVGRHNIFSMLRSKKK